MGSSKVVGVQPMLQYCLERCNYVCDYAFALSIQIVQLVCSAGAAGINFYDVYSEYSFMCAAKVSAWVMGPSIPVGSGYAAVKLCFQCHDSKVTACGEHMPVHQAI